jgi:hypothetical protein
MNMRGNMMSEPATSAAGAAIGWKMIGGLAGVLGAGAAVSAIVVMLMTPPRSPREWAVGLISTVMGSIAGGAAVIQHYSLQAWMESFTGLLAVLGIAFSCGLPAWALVRWIFTYIQNRQGKDILEVAQEAKQII